MSLRGFRIDRWRALIALCMMVMLIAPACGGDTPAESSSESVAATLTARAPEPFETAEPQPPPASPTPNLPGILPTVESPTEIAPTANPPLDEPSPTATLEPPVRIQVNGSEVFLTGVNYPWVHYGNDFGANAWGAYGVHTSDTYAQVDADFAEMAAMGMNSVRWFVFGDGRAGILFDEVGLPVGLDEYVFQDMDAALEIATRHGIYVNFVLLDFMFMWDARHDQGVQTGGHAAIINSEQGQDALIENVFVPLFDRYGSHPQILSWEIMNEPEWAIDGDGGDPGGEVSSPSSLENFQIFAARVTEEIHNRTTSYATIGAASMKWLDNWTGIGLDYYQIHYYDWMAGLRDHDLYRWRAMDMKLDKPVVVGEFPANGSEIATLQEYLDEWYTKGYSGAWSWSFRENDGHGAPDPAVLAGWNQQHALDTDIAGD